MSKMHDNRDYLYNKNSSTARVEFSIIKQIVGKNKKVIDLGCGDGSLMQMLAKRNNNCQGIEISESGVKVCRDKGFKATKGRIDTKLSFRNKEFDFAICNVTLQMVMYPEVLLSEMKRISKKQIITYPNFAFILNRMELMFFGVFPRWSLFGYKWYSTGHIHQLSIKDFEIYCGENNINILRTDHVGPIKFLAKRLPNLFATMGIFETE
jgi:methionine biosynthesis protein MetW